MLISQSETVRQNIISKNKILIWFLVSLTFLLVPVFIEIIKPIDLILKYKLRLQEGTTLYELLQHEIPAARLSLYIFNITNPEQFLSGEDEKLKVEEVGPFVFQEYRWYEEMEVSADGKEMSMTPRIRSEFDLEASVADIKNISLNLPNLPLLAASSILSNYPSLIQFTFTMLVQQLKSKAIMEINVHDFLWGFDDPILKICNNLAPSLIYFEKLGLLDRLYDNNSEYKITVGATDEDRFKIKLLKKTTSINLGNIQNVEETEQTFKDTYEGIAYPPDLSPSLPLNLYRLGVCKTFNLEYMGSRTMGYGGEGSVYTISNQTFMNDTDPITKRTFPDGVMSIAPCFYGLPYVASKGHFLDADPVYLQKVEGLHPDPSVHLNEIIIDKKVSVTFDTKMSLQLNLALNDLTYNRATRVFSNITVPIIHMKVTQPPMTPSTMYKFILAFQIGPYIILATKIFTILIGLIALGYALKLFYLKKRVLKSVTFEVNLNEKLIFTNTPLLSEYMYTIKRPSITIPL